MAACRHCGSSILFGGVTVGGYRFCNQTCARQATSLAAGSRIPAAEVEQQIRAIHQGICPKCTGPGPVDVHVSHKVWSALVMTSYHSKPELCCRSCGRRRQVEGLRYSMFLGWWGFPFGLLLTPVQIGRNLWGFFGGPKPDTPSPALEQMVRNFMGARVLQAEAQARAQAQGQ
jgi:hypothetical protein